MSDIMRKVLRLDDVEPKISAGSTEWLLARTKHLSLYVLKSNSVKEFTQLGHPEEEIVYVLQGQVEYDNGRLAKSGEAVVNLPNTPCSGKYIGIEPVWLLKVRVRPWPKSQPASKDLMKRVIKLKDIEVKTRESGSLLQVVVLTGNASVCYVQNNFVKEFTQLGHPEEEIVYVLQGQIGYDNGRLANSGEALVNLPNTPHPGRYIGTEPTVILEMKSPPSLGIFALDRK